ncbi:MAG: AIPR family protein [Phycisphaerales bacterium]|nr:AIPR family protein [Phycisphaerales bacterium]
MTSTPQRFLDTLLSDTFDHAHDPEHGGLRLSALLATVLSYLEDAGVVNDPKSAYFRDEGANYAAECHGYACDTEDDVLALFYCVDATESTPLGDSIEMPAVPKEAIDRGFRRLESFVKRAKEGKLDGIEPSQAASELVALIRECEAERRAIELHVAATGAVSDRAAFSEGRGGYRREVWDVLRLARTCGTGADESVSISFLEQHGQPLPCLVTKKGSDGIQVLLTCIHAPVLAEIYNTYRARLLERNVRSFLQFTGKVNKGIRATLLNEPERFLAYNNGLSATAARVDFVDGADDLARISAVHEFQIVNGGQTTASIASCVRKGEADLSRVFVPMKLTIVPADRVAELVPRISQFANTQNRIQEADFHANHPWHIEFQKLSRATWLPPTADSPRGTRWFYERSRGQYADELAATGAAPGRKKFRAENPPKQKITKTDLAKFVLSWDQEPAVVSRGAQKCFVEFMGKLTREARPVPDLAEFKRVVSLALLFRAAETLYGDLAFQGYRAQVVTYAIALLSHHSQRRLPWSDIWELQGLPVDLSAPLKTLLVAVREAITHPPANRNITEWCKRPECWSQLLSLDVKIDLPKGLEAAPQRGPAASETLSPADRALVECVAAVPAEVWFAVATWAKDTDTLLGWQRGLAYSLGTLPGRNRKPSLKQAIQGRKLLVEARRLGFGHEQLTPDLLGQLAQTSITPPAAEG